MIMRKLTCMILTLVMALSLTSFVFADEVIDVYVYNNSGGVTGGVSSNAEVLKELQNWFVEKTNVRLNVIVPPAEEADTKLNLMLTSGDQIDAFWGDWIQYSSLDMIQPITDIYSAEKYPGIAKEIEICNGSVD